MRSHKFGHFDIYINCCGEEGRTYTKGNFKPVGDAHKLLHNINNMARDDKATKNEKKLLEA